MDFLQKRSSEEFSGATNTQIIVLHGCEMVFRGGGDVKTVAVVSCLFLQIEAVLPAL